MPLGDEAEPGPNPSLAFSRSLNLLWDLSLGRETSSVSASIAAGFASWSGVAGREKAAAPSLDRWRRARAKKEMGMKKSRRERSRLCLGIMGEVLSAATDGELFYHLLPSSQGSSEGVPVAAAANLIRKELL